MGNLCSVLFMMLIEVVFSVCAVFVQHDAAQLFLTLWNLLKKQMKKPELVRMNLWLLPCVVSSAP